MTQNIRDDKVATFSTEEYSKAMKKRRQSVFMPFLSFLCYFRVVHLSIQNYVYKSKKKKMGFLS